MSDPVVGKFIQGSLREFWKREDAHFTPWLAEAANIAALADALGLDQLDAVQTEVSVGDFCLDILARDTKSGTLVAVENQFHKGDHTHLGQLITYAAGVSGEQDKQQLFVWIAEELRDEHRAALTWLNANTGRSIGFFGLELEVWQILEPGGQKSSPALRFNVVVQPNDWAAIVQQIVPVAPSAGDQLYLQFWEGFRQYCLDAGATLQLHSPRPKYWLASSIGRGGFGVNFTVSINRRQMAVELYIDHPAAHVALSKLEADPSVSLGLDAGVQFQKLAKHARIAVYAPWSPERSTWADAYNWLTSHGERFRAVFAEKVKLLDLNNLEKGDEDEV